jgi:hypothetical protein
VFVFLVFKEEGVQPTTFCQVPTPWTHIPPTGPTTYLQWEKSSSLKEHISKNGKNNRSELQARGQRMVET